MGNPAWLYQEILISLKQMSAKRKQQICALLKAIETGDEVAVSVVNPDKYIQHNPQTQEGGEGLAALFKRLSKTSPRVNIVRVFSDGDYVFAHTEYEFSTSRIGFEVFRFEGDYAVEHWDNIQSRKGPNSSGHTMVDGSVNVVDLDKTESNRQLIQQFIQEVLIEQQLDKLEHYINTDGYIEHNPRLADGVDVLRAGLSDKNNLLQYLKNHRLLAEGCFVLSVSEGSLCGKTTSFYDLFRVVDGRIVEHWDTTEMVPPQSEWKNDNGKF